MWKWKVEEKKRKYQESNNTSNHQRNKVIENNDKPHEGWKKRTPICQEKRKVDENHL